MPRSSRLPSNPPKRFHPDDSELETESEAESVSDYQVTSDSEEEERSSTPDSQKDAQCGVCKKNVNSSDKSLQCDTCSDWCHIKAGTLCFLFVSLHFCLTEIFPPQSFKLLCSADFVWRGSALQYWELCVCVLRSVRRCVDLSDDINIPCCFSAVESPRNITGRWWSWTSLR